MNCVENFALSDCLAAANNSAVSGVFLNKRLALFIAHVSEAHGSLALGNKAIFFLRAAFPAAQVHGGNVKQGLKPGDFNVIMPGAGHAKEVGQRYKRTPTVDVIYYPKAGDAECYGMAHRLSFVLGSITTPEGDIIHATGCEWTLAEDVLHVLLSYDHFVRVPLEQENMETLKINEEG